MQNSPESIKELFDLLLNPKSDLNLALARKPLLAYPAEPEDYGAATRGLIEALKMPRFLPAFHKMAEVAMKPQVPRVGEGTGGPEETALNKANASEPAMPKSALAKLDGRGWGTLYRTEEDDYRED